MSSRGFGGLSDHGGAPPTSMAVLAASAGAATLALSLSLVYRLKKPSTVKADDVSPKLLDPNLGETYVKPRAESFESQPESESVDTSSYPDSPQSAFRVSPVKYNDEACAALMTPRNLSAALPSTSGLVSEVTENADTHEQAQADAQHEHDETHRQAQGDAQHEIAILKAANADMSKRASSLESELAKAYENVVDLKRQLEHGQDIRISLQQSVQRLAAQVSKLEQSAAANQQTALSPTSEHEEIIAELTEQLEEAKANKEIIMSQAESRMKQHHEHLLDQFRVQKEAFLEQQEAARSALVETHKRNVAELEARVEELTGQLDDAKLEREEQKIDNNFQAMAVAGAVSMMLAW